MDDERTVFVVLGDEYIEKGSEEHGCHIDEAEVQQKEEVVLPREELHHPEEAARTEPQ